MIAKREVKSKTKIVKSKALMDDFQLAFFCFLLLICYFITKTFSLINAFPFRHCAFYLFHSKFDPSSFAWSLTDFPIYLSKWPFLKKRNCTNVTFSKASRLFSLWPSLFSRWAIERSRPRWHVACGNPAWQCVLEGASRTNCQTSFLTSKVFKTKSPGWTRNLHTKV